MVFPNIRVIEHYFRWFYAGLQCMDNDYQMDWQQIISS